MVHLQYGAAYAVMGTSQRYTQYASALGVYIRHNPPQNAATRRDGDNDDGEDASCHRADGNEYLLYYLHMVLFESRTFKGIGAVSRVNVH